MKKTFKSVNAAIAYLVKRNWVRIADPDRAYVFLHPETNETVAVVKPGKIVPYEIRIYGTKAGSSQRLG